MSQATSIARTEDRPEPGHTSALYAHAKLLRPSQWVKNAFVGAPLFFTPERIGAETVLTVGAGLVCFCALSSAVYILNDYLDRETDRLHPEKRNRPLAAGTVTPGVACVMLVLLAFGGLVGAFLLTPAFAGIAGAYLTVNIAYSIWLKHVAILDVMCIASGFVMRVIGGAALAGVAPSVWIIVCTGLLACFLAVAKRRDDLIKNLGTDHRKSLDGYTRPYLDTVMTICLGALMVSYLIYTTESEVIARLGTDKLYLTAPFVLAGVMRYLQITMVEEKSGSPTKIVLTDRFLRLACVGWLAMFSALIYL